MPTETEQAFIDKMVAEGWDVKQGGFPDFLCTKGDDAMLIEVKAFPKDRLRESQVETQTFLNNKAIRCCVWVCGTDEVVPVGDFIEMSSRVRKWKRNRKNEFAKLQESIDRATRYSIHGRK